VKEKTLAYKRKGKKKKKKKNLLIGEGMAKTLQSIQADSGLWM